MAAVGRSTTRLAEVARARLLEPGVLLVVTLRRDGSPRLSPVEPFVLEGDLMLSMLWGSLKARDLARDARVLVHSIVTGRDAVAGSLGWRPEPGRFHLFSVDISDVTFIRYDGTSATSVGDPEPVDCLLVPD